MKPLLKIREAAAHIGMSTSWLYKQCEAGVFPHVKIGRAVRFDPDRLLEWRQQQTRDVTAPVNG